MCCFGILQHGKSLMCTMWCAYGLAPLSKLCVYVLLICWIDSSSSINDLNYDVSVYLGYYFTVILTPARTSSRFFFSRKLFVTVYTIHQSTAWSFTYMSIAMFILVALMLMWYFVHQPICNCDIPWHFWCLNQLPRLLGICRVPGILPWPRMLLWPLVVHFPVGGDISNHRVVLYTLHVHAHSSCHWYLCVFCHCHDIVALCNFILANETYLYTDILELETWSSKHATFCSTALWFSPF